MDLWEGTVGSKMPQYRESPKKTRRVTSSRREARKGKCSRQCQLQGELQ